MQFLHDANLFVASSREAIERSAPHIYLSALPFADKNSLVYQDFAPYCTDLITVDTFGVGHHGGSAIMTLTNHGGIVFSVAYSPDGLLLASGSADGTVRVWDTLTGEEAVSPLYSGDGCVLSVDVARNNKWVASGTEAGVICIWNITSITSGRVSHRRLIGHSNYVWSAVFSPDSCHLASASRDQTVCLWNSETGEQLRVLNGHGDSVSSVVFSPAGDILASISSDGTVRLWQSTTGQPIREPLKRNGGHSIDFAPHGEIIAFVGASRFSVMLWQIQTGKIVAELQGESCINSIRFSPDSRSLVAAHGQDVRVWTLQPNLTDASWVDLRGHSDNVRSVTFSPDGRYIASASDDGTIRIWVTGSGQSGVQPLPAHGQRVTSVAVSRAALLHSDHHLPF